MNLTNLTADKIVLSSIPSYGLFYQVLDQITLILLNYLGRVISGFGILLNTFFLFLLLKKCFKNQIYNYFWSRAFCNLIASIFGVIFVQFPLELMTYEKYTLIHQLYISGFGTRAVLMASSVSDILLIVNRYYSMTERRNSFFAKISKKTNLFLCYFIGITLFIPFCFGGDFVETENKNFAYWKLSQFGSSAGYKAYFLLSFMLESVIVVIILLVFNSMAITKFRGIMTNKTKVTKKKTKAEKANIRFTKYSLVLSIICLIVRTLDMLAGILVRIEAVQLYVYTPEQRSLKNICRQFAFFVLFTSQAFEVLIYFKMDKNVKKSIIEIFEQTRLYDFFLFFNILSVLILIHF